jgi:hypothetical protein
VLLLDITTTLRLRAMMMMTTIGQSTRWRSRRRLDATIAKYPELVGPIGPDNVIDWIETLQRGPKLVALAGDLPPARRRSAEELR